MHETFGAAVMEEAPAFAVKQEQRVGEIAEGMLGDLVVLSADPREVGIADLPAIPVHATVVDGVLAYARELG